MDIAITEPQQAVAWRIEFAERALGDEAPLIRQPRRAWVRAHEVNMPSVLLDTAAPESTADSLTFIYLPPGGMTPYEVQKQAEGWMASRHGEEGGTLEVQFRNERLLWRRGRAVCFGTPHATEEIFAAVTAFSFCEGELTRLERQISASWTTLDQDLEMIRLLNEGDLERLRHIDAMTQMATTMNVAHVRLWAALETPPGDIAGPARRLFLELALQANTEDRLERLGDAIEAFDDFYWDIREDVYDYHEFRYQLLDHELAKSDHELAKSDHELAKSDHELAKADYELSQNQYRLSQLDHELAKSDHELAQSDYRLSRSQYRLSLLEYRLSRSDYRISFWILLVLAAELLVLVSDFLVTHDQLWRWILSASR
jgi:hypothetical protein